ncbi:MAG: hypothetical protein HY674_04000 [Chloroflexi bacterium]|nr:hypothetical protein [Chloroflexota bacterium]
MRVSILYATNDAARPLVWGMFQVENHLKEPVTVSGGIFELWDGRQWAEDVGSVACTFGGERQFESSTTNVAQMMPPRTPGRYRLHVRYRPKSYEALKFVVTSRYRFLQPLLRTGLIPATNRLGKPYFSGYWTKEPRRNPIASSQPIQVPAYQQPLQHTTSNWFLQATNPSSGSTSRP